MVHLPCRPQDGPARLCVRSLPRRKVGLQMAKQVVYGLVLGIAIAHVRDNLVQNGARGGDIADGVVDQVEPFEHDAV
jgi:hypothetical protein